MVQQLADRIARQHTDLKGFNRPNLFRMRQLYETYNGDEKVAPLVRQLSWTHNLLILSRSKRPEEREFYLRMALRERWCKRELERQLTNWIAPLFKLGKQNGRHRQKALCTMRLSAILVDRNEKEGRIVESMLFAPYRIPRAPKRRPSLTEHPLQGRKPVLNLVRLELPGFGPCRGRSVSEGRRFGALGYPFVGNVNRS